MRVSYLSLILALFACTLVAEDAPKAGQVREMMSRFYGSLTQAEIDTPPTSQKDLGRMLYFDKRLSADRKTSCNDCHSLENYGSGGEAWKALRKQHRDMRAPPSMYHAALLDYAYWDGGFKRGDQFSATNNPFLNAFTRDNEMALGDFDELETSLREIKGYRALFKKSFPADKQPITAENAGTALRAFATGLITPAPYDRFMDGDDSALAEKEIAGAMLFVRMDCAACHTGPYFGGQMVQKLGVVVPWPNQTDTGYHRVAGNPQHKMYFRVASLRNAAKTAPYFHDSSVFSLKTAIRTMSMYESGRHPDSEDVDRIAAFIGSLTGTIPQEYIKEPKLPE